MVLSKSSTLKYSVSLIFSGSAVEVQGCMGCKADHRGNCLHMREQLIISCGQMINSVIVDFLSWLKRLSDHHHIKEKNKLESPLCSAANGILQSGCRGVGIMAMHCLLLNTTDGLVGGVAKVAPPGEKRGNRSDRKIEKMEKHCSHMTDSILWKTITRQTSICAATTEAAAQCYTSAATRPLQETVWPSKWNSSVVWLIK